MRVLLTTPYDLAVPGGVNRHVLGLAAALGRHGHDVRVVGPASAPVRVDGVEVVALGTVRTLALNGATTRFTMDAGRVVLGLRRLIANFRPDVVHAHEPVFPLPCAAALWLAPRGTRRVGTFHTFSETGRGYLWAWPWVEAVWSSLDARIAVSESAREFATRYHRAEFSVVPHAIEPVRRAAAVRTTEWTERGPVRNEEPAALRVLFVGRMDEPRKGFGCLLAAVRRMHAVRPWSVELTAVGRGADPWRAGAAGLPVKFAGEVADGALAAHYERAEVCVVPSLGGESFGLVALEALAHGLPVVASRIRGHTEWLAKTGAAELFAAGDAAELAVVLEALASDRRKLQTSSGAAVALAARYGWDTLVERLIAVGYGGAR